MSFSTNPIPMRKIIFILLVFTASTVHAQEAIIDSSLRMWSLGFNARRIAPNFSSYDPSPVGFAQYRFGNNAFRLTFASASYYDDASRRLEFPAAIMFNDSMIVLQSSYTHRFGEGFGIEYNRYFYSRNPEIAEIHVGIGLYGGSINNNQGINYLIYKIDSNGVFQNDLINDSTLHDPFYTYRSFQFGLVPSIGLMLWPRNILGLELEARFPFYLNETHNGSEYSFYTQLAVNAVVNFRFKKMSLPVEAP